MITYRCVAGEGKYVKDDVDRKEFTLLGIILHETHSKTII